MTNGLCWPWLLALVVTAAIQLTPSLPAPLQGNRLTSDPLSAANTSGPRIVGIEARLFFPQSATFSPDVLHQKGNGTIVLYDVVAGGALNEPSTSTLVLVRIEGSPAAFVAQPRVQLTVTTAASGRVVLQRTAPIDILDGHGRTTVPYWLYDTGCEPLTLTARLIDAKVSPPLTEHLEFHCGE